MTVDLRSLSADLGSVCRAWRELEPLEDAALAVDGVVPPLWCEPADVQELAAVVKLAHATGASVIPRGGGTRMSLGNPPRRADLLLSTGGLSRIVEYVPADLTITVEAGLGFAELQAKLAGERQLLALDPPSGARATIGGIVASNASGPLRLQYGSARDLVIGTRVANADGVLTKAGGRVVKNVAGYDLNKLYVGSLGALGIIVELSFKLHPLPPCRGTVVAVFDGPAEAEAVVRRVMRSPLGPAALEVLDPAAAGLVVPEAAISSDGCVLLVLVGGFENAVARVCAEVATLCSEQGRAETRADDRPTQALWETVRELADASDPDSPVLKLSLPLSRSIEGFERLRAATAAATLPATIVARAGVGLIFARFERREWTSDDLGRLAQLVLEVRAFAVEREGSLVVEAAPAALKQQVDAWGEVGPALKLMRSLKHQLDPEGTLNPGRFVGGI